MMTQTDNTHRISRTTTLIEVGTRAWSQALEDFYHPPLPEPVIEYDEDASSYFYIDTTTWTVHLNTVGVPNNFSSEDAEWFLRSICHHEIQHYMRCPYDGVTHGMMLARAMNHLDEKRSLFVCNLFSDLVVDSYLLKRFNRLTHDRINASIHESALRSPSQSPMWQLIVAVYRIMWGFSLPPNHEIDKENVAAAEEIVKIAKKYLDDERRWHIATEKIAKIVKNWLQKYEPQNNINESLVNELHKSSDNSDSPDNSSGVPRDVDEIMGDPSQVRNNDVIRRCARDRGGLEIEKEMERLAIEVERRGGDLNDLNGVYIVAGVGDPNREWIRFWYRAKTKRMLRIEGRVQRRAGSFPLNTDVWRLGEPIEELDFVQSLQAFPVLVPNMSTRRWLKIEGTEEIQTASCPDVLIVIDSSGSMTWNMNRTSISGAYHYALLASFAAIEAVLSHGRQVAVINFSDDIKTCPFTNDRHRLEATLLQYQGGGTVAPVTKIEELCNTAEAPVLILVMTDADISNWDLFLQSIQRLLSRRHVIYLFRVGGQMERIDKELSHIGAHLVPLASPDYLLAQPIFFNPRLS